MADLSTKVVVIGSGPAGLMAALTAAGQGASVTLLEALPSPGRKLLTSGAGKCNFTNMLTAQEMIERFAPEQRRFIRPALMEFTPDLLRKFFRNMKLDYKLVDDFYCFPITEKAGDILQTLLDKLYEYNVQVVCNAKVTDIEVQNDIITKVYTSDRSYPCNAVIAAGGGPGYPALGGRGSLDEVLQKHNVAMLKRTPALCGLKTCDAFLQNLGGVLLEKAEVYLDKQNFSRGDVIFSDNGFSGPAVQDISGQVGRRLAAGEKVVIKLNFKPELSAEDWLKIIEDARKSNGKRLVYNVLNRELPQAIVQAITASANAQNKIIAELDKAACRKLIENLTGCPVHISGTERWEKAMASAGGADRKFINPKTMQSKQLNNLYFAGEFIDVDGPCGGFNIQWAFSSGRLAGLLRNLNADN